jgi:hypothetical protein
MAPYWNEPGACWDDPRIHFDDPRTFAEITANIMSEKTTSYPVNEVLGFGDGTKEMLTALKAEMITKGVDPTAVIGLIGPAHTNLTTENIKQEGMKTALKVQTEVVENSKGALYTVSSQGIDLIISAYGRTSEKAKEATALRKSVRPARTKKTTTPPTPPTP